MKEIYIDFAGAARKLNSFGYTLFPLHGKKPAVRIWKKFIGNQQSIGALNKLFRRPNITALGVVLENNLRVLDIDGTDDEKIIDELLKWLGLPNEYKHIVKSGNGFHIYFYCKDEEKIIEKYFGSDQARYKIRVKDEYKLKQIDLMMRDCYMVGPYSIHPSGKKYLYLNGEPKERAAKIKPEGLLKAIKVIQVPEKKVVVKKAKNAVKVDLELIQSVTNYLKRIKLNHQEWIQCGFAYCSIGPEGKKYFILLSINAHYPKDTKRSVSKKYDELFKRYNESKIMLGTLFHIAKKHGYKMPIKKEKRKAEFLEFVLCVLSYPEKDDKKLLIMILHYSMIEKIDKEFINKKERLEELNKMIKRLQDYNDKKIVIQNHKLIKNYVDEFVNKYGEQPYCRIGEDFFREVIQGKFDPLTFRILCSVTAVQGKKSKWKIISKERMKSAIFGYKSIAVYNNENKRVKSISDYQIRERVKNLRTKNIISYITLFRNSYYSTFITQKQLSDIAEERYNKNLLKKLETDAEEKELKENMRENKKSLEKEFFEKLQPKVKIKSNRNSIYVN